MDAAALAWRRWASLTAKGVDKAKAGELVRKAFGDYDNLTATERKISRALPSTRGPRP